MPVNVPSFFFEVYHVSGTLVMETLHESDFKADARSTIGAGIFVIRCICCQIICTNMYDDLLTSKVMYNMQDDIPTRNMMYQRL